MKTNHIPDSANNSSYQSFLLCPRMSLGNRMFLGGVSILAGLMMQYITLEEWMGALLLFVGNLFFLIRGVKVIQNTDISGQIVARKWERAEVSRIDTLIEHDKKIARWNLSAWDLSNPLGFFVFIIIAAICGLGYMLGHNEDSPLLRILFADAAVLLLPHWITGMRRSHRIPALMIRAQILSKVIEIMSSELNNLEVDALFELPEVGEPLPSNVKLRMRRKELPESFLGLEVHVSLNEVEGTNYPYLYCVLIARKDFGLKDLIQNITATIQSEFNIQDDVEVLVLRQPTTKKSGYHTKPQIASVILAEGITAMHRIPSPTCT